jgi:hypothetical protein
VVEQDDNSIVRLDQIKVGEVIIHTFWAIQMFSFSTTPFVLN